MFPEARVLAPDELHVGLTAEFERDVTDEDVVAFARLSGDCNPLHVDPDYAGRSNFQGRIAHGAYQVGLASALIGMHLPGRNVLLGSVSARFPAPLYFPGRVRVRGEVTAWNPDTLGGQVKVVVLDAGRGVPTAEVVLGFTYHQERRDAKPAVVPDRPLVVPSGQPVVLVTGAAGGLGSAVLAELARGYAVLALVHRQPLGDSFDARPGVEVLTADVTGPGWEDTVRSALGGGRLYGIVHAAWPGAPGGGLLDTPTEVLEQQLAFGTTGVVRLARLLAATAGEQGGRLVVLGATSGTRKPVLNRAAFSLGKAALEHTVRLLAPELARKNITVNAVCPSFVPAGMNRQAHDRQLKLEAAQVPLGRLCTPQDVAAAVCYLLSPAAGFVSGQFLGLTGGQL